MSAIIINWDVDEDMYEMWLPVLCYS